MTRYWCINGRFLTQRITGVQRYAREIVCALDQVMSTGHPLTKGLEVELVVPRGTPDLPHLQAIRLCEAGRIRGHVWEQVVLPGLVRDGLVSLCNTGPIAANRHIICMHDANVRLFPASYSLSFRILYRTLQPMLGRRALAVTSVSHSSAGELARFGIVAQKNVRVIPNGHEHALRWQPKHTADTRTAAGPNTIVVIGSPAPHKNIELVLGLAPRLAAAGLRVAVVGVRDARVFKEIQAEAQSANVVWLGRLSDEALAALLKDSLCLAFPSLTEGFGLPLLEAMALGCPVITSDRASMPEICADAALYAPPTMPGMWLDHFLRLRQDQSLRTALITRGRDRVRMYSWRQSALLYLELMATADEMAAR
jgi:glycosyltransferase involved in cell wall biosynthesis